MQAADNSLQLLNIGIHCAEASFPSKSLDHEQTYMVQNVLVGCCSVRLQCTLAFRRDRRYATSMSEVLAQVIREAITIRERELEELRQKLREAESDSNGGRKRRRSRKESGPRPGSIPALILECLEDAGGKPLGAADISERLAKKDKKVESRFVAAAISRYIKANKLFAITPEGLYMLRKNAA